MTVIQHFRFFITFAAIDVDTAAVDVDAAIDTAAVDAVEVDADAAGVAVVDAVDVDAAIDTAAVDAVEVDAAAAGVAGVAVVDVDVTLSQRKLVFSLKMKLLCLLMQSPVGTVSDQCDQIGRFLKVLVNKWPCKSSPNIQQHFWAIVNNGIWV